MPIQTDSTLLQMALVGYEVELLKIQAKIDEIKSRLGGRRGRPSTAVASTATPTSHTKRSMSAVARRRIAAAQKKRWAEYRKQKAA